MVQKSRRVFQSTMAVLAGMAVVIILSTVTDLLLQQTGYFSKLAEPIDDARLLLATAYRCVYAIMGGYVAARLAPHQPMWHAVSLGVVGLVLSIAGLVATWGIGHEWYPLALVLTAVPCAWLGGRLCVIPRRAAAFA